MSKRQIDDCESSNEIAGDDGYHGLSRENLARLEALANKLSR